MTQAVEDSGAARLPEYVTQVFGPDHGGETDWLVLTGIADDNTGTGRFVQHIVRDLREGRADGVRILCSPLGARLDGATVARAVAAPALLILHPQFLGRAETIEIIEKRAEAGRRTFYYILDSSFFCQASYNHVPGEMQPCLRCLGGHTGAARAKGCAAGPNDEPFARLFADRLRPLGASGQVVFLAQNHNHAALARRQFGPRAEIRVVGLWCRDWDSAFAAFEKGPIEAPPMVDVVFHGHVVMAKGITWLLQVAARTPGISYLVPADPASLPGDLPANIFVHPLSWETGLAAAMAKSRLVVVPSLWSASIEGALAKSLAAARAVGTVHSPSAFSAELPEGLIARLSPDPAKAAGEVGRLIETEWRPDPDLKAAFVRDFMAFNRGVVGRILPGALPDDGALPALDVPAEPLVARGPEARVMRDVALLRPAYPRSFPGCLEIDGRPVRFADLHGFFFQYRQIFGERLYAFEAGGPDPYILDCGAHIGLASLFLAQLHPGATIDAFEADPALAALARDNLAAWGVTRATVHAKAVWVDEAGVRFERSGDDAGHVAGQGETVPSVRLRDWLQGQPVGLLKLDVEGAEYPLIADCAGALDRVERMIVEVHHLNDEQGRVGDILAHLGAAGFAYGLVDLQQAPWAGGQTPPFEALRTDRDLVTVLAWRP